MDPEAIEIALILLDVLKKNLIVTACIVKKVSTEQVEPEHTGSEKTFHSNQKVSEPPYSTNPSPTQVSSKVNSIVDQRSEAVKSIKAL